MPSAPTTYRDSAHWSDIGETRREALGRFLRQRREALAPEQVGISSHRGRRTPGLRREEVAFLADIGVKWYARLEAGDEIHPSAATLTAVAVALRLSDAELEYMLDLAGLRQPTVRRTAPTTVPDALRAFVTGTEEVAATLCDRILTPLLWNATSEGVYGHSRYETPVERNGLVRLLSDSDFIAFVGAAREELLAKAVGMFRLNYSSPSPSAHAAAVYERVKEEPLFQQLWKHRIVANDLSSNEVSVRNHAVVGTLQVYTVDFGIAQRGDLFARVLIPANDATASKLAQLRRLGNSAAVPACSLHL